MTAIFKRELRSYFQTALGAAFIGAVFFFSGYFFMVFNVYGGTTDLSAMFSNMFTVLLFLIPILTMRLLSEENRSGTSLILYASRVSRAGIVIGKYLAAVVVYLLALLSTVIMVVIMLRYARPDLPVIAGNFLGLAILGLALISICMFLSSLTESQVIAAICGFGASLLLMLIDSFAAMFPGKFIKQLLIHLSFSKRYNPFTFGILDLSHTVFFLTIAALFVCLTVVVLERKRWY